MTEQAPFESLQVSLENFPELLLDQSTVPVGLDPLTVALQEKVVPTVTDVFMQDTATTVPPVVEVVVEVTLGRVVIVV